MSNLEKTLFQLKFTGKTLARQAKKAQKDENTEKARLKKYETKRTTAGATARQQRRYADLRLQRYPEEKRVSQPPVTGNMTSIVKGMDKAMETMNLELHLLNTSAPPSKLIITGNSAGGNLALQIVAQLPDPHPLLPSPPADPLCFGGLLLLSPWMEFGADAPPHTCNEACDVLPLAHTASSSTA
ncbi:hypothetical protein V8E53_004766 [Lactarius tabidus]